MSDTFLKAEWRKLIMVNYSIDKTLLNKYLPSETEIDLFNDVCYLSLVGFMFLNTSIKGFKIPFHKNFEEVNLRFYVKRNENNRWKRGVVFIKEIVPKAAVSFIANTLFKENYETLPMEHEWEVNEDTLTIEYKWKKKRWNSLKVIGENLLKNIEERSEEEFITEHYYGFTKINNTKTMEYSVEHPRWQIYKVNDYFIDVDFNNIYREEFGFLKDEKSKSVFLAEGSEIQVRKPVIIK
jgi:uncharacterized protein